MSFFLVESDSTGDFLLLNAQKISSHFIKTYAIIRYLVIYNIMCFTMALKRPANIGAVSVFCNINSLEVTKFTMICKD